MGSLILKKLVSLQKNRQSRFQRITAQVVQFPKQKKAGTHIFVFRPLCRVMGILQSDGMEKSMVTSPKQSSGSQPKFCYSVKMFFTNAHYNRIICNFVCDSEIFPKNILKIALRFSIHLLKSCSFYKHITPGAFQSCTVR